MLKCRLEFVGSVFVCVSLLLQNGVNDECMKKASVSLRLLSTIWKQRNADTQTDNESESQMCVYVVCRENIKVDIL